MNLGRVKKEKSQFSFVASFFIKKENFPFFGSKSKSDPIDRTNYENVITFEQRGPTRTELNFG